MPLLKLNRKILKFPFTKQDRAKNSTWTSNTFIPFGDYTDVE